MRIELKKAILKWICENVKVFQLNNVCHEKFREYIYSKSGNYLIDGKGVSQFIDDAIKLITREL